jgi:hypothetical protein
MARTTTAAFNTERDNKQNRPIELLDIFFGSQTADDASTLHYAIWDEPVDFFNIDAVSKTYTPIGVRRSGATNVMDNEQRQMTLEIDNINRAFQALFFQNADFMRDKRVVLRHVFKDALAAAANAVVILDGLIASVRITERICQMELAGVIGQMQFQTGRVIDRLCPLNFAAGLCAAGTTAATLLQEATDTVTGSSTKSALFFSTINKADKYFAVGTVEGVTGQNAGLIRKVIKWTSSTKKADLDFVLPFTPANGDQFKIRRDCDKTILECTARYVEVHATNGNKANFAGFPSVVNSVNP